MTPPRSLKWMTFHPGLLEAGRMAAHRLCPGCRLYTVCAPAGWTEGHGGRSSGSTQKEYAPQSTVSSPPLHCRHIRLAALALLYRYDWKQPCPVSACDMWYVSGTSGTVLPSQRPMDGMQDRVQDAFLVASHLCCHCSTVWDLSSLFAVCLDGRGSPGVMLASSRT